MIKSHISRLIAVTTSLLAVSCAPISTVETNLDRKNFEHYFSPGQVTIYKQESEFDGKYKMLGMVEGESCQVKPHHAAPDVIDARTDARRAAYQLGANAIVFSGCTQVQTKECHAVAICYGKAYQVEQAQ
ncbi:Rcs stress response system protein RcsF [Colwellia sp. MEBiC06753]